MTLREITTSDIPTLFRIRVQTWHNSRGAEEMTRLGITPDSVTELLQTSHRGWIAEVDNQPVGFAMGDKVTGEMWVIAVLSAFENQRIGRALLTKVEQWLFTSGHKTIWLTTDIDENFRAVGFYRHLGWQDWKFADGDRFMRKSASSDLTHLLTAMTPVLDDEIYVFVTIPAGSRNLNLPSIGSFIEDEGTTLICLESDASDADLQKSDAFKRITLQVHSSLDAVGFIARISPVLAAEHIPCNVISAFHHDHLFVPAEMADQALRVLSQLSRNAPA